MVSILLLYQNCELLPQLYRSTFLHVARGGFLLHCCKVPTSTLKMLQPTWEEALFRPILRISVFSVFWSSSTPATRGNTLNYNSTSLLGSRAIFGFFECTADKSPDPELTRNFAQNSKCLKLSAIHLLNMLNNSGYFKGSKYVSSLLGTALKLQPEGQFHRRPAMPRSVRRCKQPTRKRLTISLL